MSNPDEQEEPKIIVDSDWKEQVKAEKEKLAQEQASQEQAAKPADSAASEQVEPQAGMEFPPASFAMLVTTLATQAAAALGQIPDPIEGKPVVNKAVAKHFIDTLGVLEVKTKGNLTEDESQLLEATLHELRFAFVQR